MKKDVASLGKEIGSKARKWIRELIFIKVTYVLEGESSTSLLSVVLTAHLFPFTEQKLKIRS